MPAAQRYEDVIADRSEEHPSQQSYMRLQSHDHATMIFLTLKTRKVKTHRSINPAATLSFTYRTRQ